MDEAKIAQLRAKWAPVAAKEHAAASSAAHPVAATAPAVWSATTSEPSSTPAASTATPEELAAAHTRLDKLRVCGQCDGSGTEKVTYNHMSMSRTCLTCQGDGLLRRDGKPADLDTPAVVPPPAVDDTGGVGGSPVPTLPTAAPHPAVAAAGGGTGVAAGGSGDGADGPPPLE